MGTVSLTDKRVVITGSARGPGRGFAEAALDGGARAVIADILEDRGRETAEEVSAAGEGNCRQASPGGPGLRRALWGCARPTQGGTRRAGM